MPHRQRIERFSERLPEEESGGMLEWIQDNPVLSSVLGVTLVGGGLAAGHYSGLFQGGFFQRWAPWLNKAGEFIGKNAMTFWNWLLLTLGIRKPGTPDPGIDPRLMGNNGAGPNPRVSPPRP